MATNSPIRNSHLRRRVEAYASALYYSECSVGGISHDDAAQAKDTALSQQSRWWLNGNDPSHPSLQCYVDEMAKDDIKTSCQDDGIRTDDENEDDSDVENNPEDDEVQEPEDDDMISNTPITVRDDDMGTSFGTMHSFRATSSPPTFAAASQPALQLPSWLTEQNHPQDDDTSSPRDVFVQSEASSDEVLQSYSSYQNKQYLTGSQTSDSTTLPNSSPMAAAQVTSESEADESNSSSLSCDESTVFYPKPRSQAIVGYRTNTNSRKRCRLTADNFLLPLDQTYLDAKIEKTKVELLSRLENEGTTGPNFKIALATLEKYASFKVSTNKRRKLNTSDPDSSTNIDGTWLTVSAPECKSSLGKNDQGEQLYTLGRMAFDMYQPADLVCSIQKQYNTVSSVEKKALPMYVPKSLREEVDNERTEDGSERLKTYNIICSFTIEGNKGSLDDVTHEDKEPLKGIMTNYGYALPDPTHPDRKSIWFTGGTIEPAEDNRLDEWQKIFAAKTDDEATEDGANDDDTSKKDKEAEKARKLASKILLGIVHEPMDDQGIVGYHLHRPIGGHGSAYVDVVYIDDDLRIMRGHSGSIYVLKKV